MSKGPGGEEQSLEFQGDVQSFCSLRHGELLLKDRHPGQEGGGG